MKTLSTLFWVLSLLSAPSLTLGSTDTQNVLWKVAGKDVQFASIPGRHLLISSSCVQQDSSLSCEAYNSLPNASTQGLSSQFRHGGANPGAVICGRKLGGKIVTGSDEHSNEQSFCLFGDGSMVSSGSILFWASHNPGGLK